MSSIGLSRSDQVIQRFAKCCVEWITQDYINAFILYTKDMSEQFHVTQTQINRLEEAGIAQHEKKQKVAAEVMRLERPAPYLHSFFDCPEKIKTFVSFCNLILCKFR